MADIEGERSASNGADNGGEGHYYYRDKGHSTPLYKKIISFLTPHSYIENVEFEKTARLGYE
jgi:hypothetical protein